MHKHLHQSQSRAEMPVDRHTMRCRYETVNIDAETMQETVGAACELLKAMANSHRLMILCHLIEGEKSVGQLAEALGIRDSTASQHLALLRRDRLISGRRDGQMVWYRIDSDAARQVVKVLYESFCAPAAASHTPVSD